MFQTILTRNDDSYLSLQKRKQLLRNHHIDLLLSIHSDSSLKQYVSGASIWMIANARINREVNNYINNETNIYLSKNIKNVFNANKNDTFLKKTILELQLNDFRKIELDVAACILEQFKNNVKVHKKSIDYANLAILSCINIPSILIETGFISNLLEEKKLNTADYQNKIANCIYLALKNYFCNVSKIKK